MANVIILYWRDIPAQVIAEQGRGRSRKQAKFELDKKFYFISGSGNKNHFTKKNLSKISKSLKKEQKKFNISLCGGDTTFSNKLSFTIISLGYSKSIVYRNKSRLNDDIYVTGNLGDSFIGLQILKGKIKVNNKISIRMPIGSTFADKKTVDESWELIKKISNNII